MPKIVDHQLRRAELAAALWRVVGRAGMSAATVRAVADEAGWSTGALRYYFDSQDALLAFAVELLMERVPQRLREHLVATDLTPVERARRLLLELVPTQEEVRIEATVYLAVLERASTDPALEAARLAAWDGSRHVCRLVVAILADAPWPQFVGDRLDGARLEELAADLHTWADGATLQGARWPERVPPAEQLAATDRQLAALLQGIRAR